MNPEWTQALVGGIIIGLAVTLLLVFNGRVTGISGILNGILTPLKDDTLWRFLFVLGLFFGGLVMNLLKPELFQTQIQFSGERILIAGFLVGFGTVMGSGCTSGHGVCGISRLSVRSIIATLVFMAMGMICVFILENYL